MLLFSFMKFLIFHLIQNSSFLYIFQSNIIFIIIYYSILYSIILKISFISYYFYLFSFHFSALHLLSYFSFHSPFSHFQNFFFFLFFSSILGINFHSIINSSTSFLIFSLLSLFFL